MQKPSEHPLAICFQIAQRLGEQGEAIWKVGKSIADPKARLEYLHKALSFVREKAQEAEKWERIPVDFRTFLESEHFLNRPNALWPEVMKAGEEINSGRYVECVLTGGIGVGKSFLAICTQAYQLYILTCMREPHQAFDLDPSSAITIVFQSLNKELAKDVDYSTFRAMIDDSPYFRVHEPYDKERASDMRFLRKRIIVKPVSGEDTAAIGQNVIGGILDEVNFMAVVEKSKVSKDGGTYDQAISNYNSIARRRESRFMQLGDLPGMLCLVSSRNYPGQFTDKKEAEAKTNPRIYIYDKRSWEVRPWLFGDKRFRVFCGDATRKPRILRDEEDVARADYNLVMEIPVEYRHQFEADLLSALRDIAGVATQALHPFMMNIEAVAACFGRVASIISREDCDFVNTQVQILRENIVNREHPRYAHVDLAISRDSAGISIGHVPKFVTIKRGEAVEIMPLIQFDMILEVPPPKGGEIEFENIHQLLYDLRDKYGIPIKWVSFDSFQSKSSLQTLYRQGFITGHLSMDVNTFAYDLTKSAFYDDRVRAPEHAKALHELTTLEFDPKANKIDHSPFGSKDVSDSMAGVICGLTMRREVWVKHRIPTHRAPQILRTAPTSKDSMRDLA